jgi:hypothetical protein
LVAQLADPVKLAWREIHDVTSPALFCLRLEVPAEDEGRAVVQVLEELACQRPDG